jgi:hypothetical protein
MGAPACPGVPWGLGFETWDPPSKGQLSPTLRACVRTPFPISVPQGRLEMGRDAILDNLQPSLRDSIMLHDVPRTSVLG